jgi:hypothetical protein
VAIAEAQPVTSWRMTERSGRGAHRARRGPGAAPVARLGRGHPRLPGTRPTTTEETRRDVRKHLRAAAKVGG